MRKKNHLSAFILIGIGSYFLLKQLQIPLLNQFTLWPALLIIIGTSFLLHSYLNRDHDKIFPGVFILGTGIHLHGLATYGSWIDNWGIYALIIGIALLLRFQKTKTGLYPGLLMLSLGLFVILTANHPILFDSIQQRISSLIDYWPVGLIIFGIYLLIKKK